MWDSTVIFQSCQTVLIPGGGGWYRHSMSPISQGEAESTSGGNNGRRNTIAAARVPRQSNNLAAAESACGGRIQQCLGSRLRRSEAKASLA